MLEMVEMEEEEGREAGQGGEGGSKTHMEVEKGMCRLILAPHLHPIHLTVEEATGHLHLRRTTIEGEEGQQKKEDRKDIQN